MQTIDFKRQRFSTLVDEAKKYDTAPMLSKIRICVPLAVGQQAYDFDIKDAKGHKTNRALKDNDMFVPYAMSLGYMVEDDALPGHAPTFPYPVQVTAALTAIGLKGLVANGHGYLLYQGTTSIRTNQTVNVQELPNSLFLHVPKAENAGVTGSNIEESAYILPERFDFSGKRDHKIRTEFPAIPTTTIAGEAGSKAYLVLEMYGWTIQSGATL
ncbi:hypothetical protein TRIP_D300133 [uncultured Paludibacter sp.]|nr:hypothetical protein TRIP_D300133 [uncultured Paludibacter sp.]